MPLLPDFALVTYLSRHERAVRHPLSSSYPESLTVGELLALAGDAEGAALLATRLDYAPIRGRPDLRESIAATYETCGARDVVCFAGGDEAIYAACHALLEPGDHTVVVTPAYQSLETIPASIGRVTAVPLDPDRGWWLDPARIAAAIQPATKLVIVNTPHNPTGAVIPPDDFAAIVATCRDAGVWLLSDEVYRLTERPPARPLPQAADVYERGLSLNVLSKSYGLPGLRVGWIASREEAVLHRLERMRQYLTVSNAPPTEGLAVLALAAAPAILERNASIARRNLAVLGDALSGFPERLAWREPPAGLLAFLRLTDGSRSDEFARRLLDDTGVLVVPSTVYASQNARVPDNYVRVGFGRGRVAEAAGLMAGWLRRTS